MVDSAPHPSARAADSAELHLELEALRALTNSYAQAVWATDAFGVVREDSPSWRAYTGQTCDECVGRPWLDALHPDDRADAERQWRNAVAARRPVNLECRVRWAAGGWRWTNVRAVPITAADGAVLKWVGLNVDIHGRKEAEAALRESERRLSALFETLPVGVGLVSPTGALLLANQEMLRYVPNRAVPSRDRVDGYRRWRGYHSDGRPIERGDYPSDRVRRGERVVPGIEFLFTQDDGREMWTRVAALPIVDTAGQVTEIVAIITDIDALKRTQEALRENEERLRALLETLEERVRGRTSELAATNAALKAEVAIRRAAEDQIKALFKRLVSVQEEERRRIARDIHDQLGQTLTALRLQLELLRADSRLPVALGAAVERTQRMSTEIDSSIDFLTWQLRPAALDHLGLSAALARLAEGWTARFGIPAEYAFAGAEPPPHSAEIDANLYQIAQEALHNVCKHAHAGHVTVLLQHLGGSLQLTVEDDGRGFDASPQPLAGSDQLGLVSMRERAALVGGDLQIESSEHGTTVLVRIPLDAAG